jgi:hypothetical protein
VKCTIVSLQELSRFQIPHRYLQGHIDSLRAYVPLVSSKLIFNIDETGLSDWEERKPKQALVSAECENRQLHHPVDRGIRHQMLVGCISAFGNLYYPLLLSTNREVAAIFDCGERENIDLQIKIVDFPYMTGDIFIEYLRHTLILAVESNQRLPDCLNKPAILFCDNCARHYNEEILKEMA